MGDRGKSQSTMLSMKSAASSDKRPPLDRIRSLERRRNMEWRREQLRREEWPLVPESSGTTFRERLMGGFRNLLNRTTEDFSEDEDEEGEEEDSREGRRENPGVGILWRFSFWVTMTLFAHVFMSGATVQASFVPEIVERDPIPRIRRRRSRHSGGNSQ